MANTDLSRFQLPFIVGFSDALSTGFDSLMALLIGLTQFWWLAIVGFLCWIAFRQYQLQKRSRPAVLSSADGVK